MSYSDSDIDDIMAQADGDASEDATTGGEEASEDSIDAMFGDGAEEASEDSIGALFGDSADDGDGLSIDEILGKGGAEIPESAPEGAVNPALQKFEDRVVNDVDIVLDATTEGDAWIYANNKYIARGEVMVVGENLGVPITENVTKSRD